MTPRIPDDSSVLVVGPSEWRRAVDTALGGVEVRTATDRADALPIVESVDAAVVRASTDAETCRAIRERRPSLPIVACAPTADESIEAAARNAGATATLAATDVDRLATLVGAVTRTARADGDRDRREADRLFDAAFEDGDLRWVLDADGRIRRTNPAAAEAVDVEPDEVDGDRWWDGPWWTAGDTQELRARVRQAREDGESTRLETTSFVEPGARTPVEVIVRAAGDDRLLATAVDVGERAKLAERLRRSEELHRVTLNNMTDTVLVTDEEGRFTYICPNVHFIFGYTVDEIEAMGTIDELLGTDLYDPEALDERGVLTNVECVTTDKAGEEHTLLVNVKEVSIQDGTTLYSCRDVTKRKQRERALSALHHTARDLSYAETDREIAEVVVEDSAAVLSREAVALYGYDQDENLLRPTVTSAAMDRRYGPLHPIEPSDSGVGRAFLEGSPVADVRVGGELSGGRALCLPLGDHGTFVVGTPEPVDDVTREVAELVAATAEAAFDRVERENALRERDRRLSKQNRQLERAKRINDLIREVDRSIVRAETRQEIEAAVCQRLVAADRFEFAWIGEHAAAGDVVRPRERAGADRGYLDRAFEDGPDPSEPAARAAAENAPSAVVNVAEAPRAAPWRKAALACGFQSVVSVPLLADETSHGTLTVYATRAGAFDDVTRSVLAELGRTVGSAISAVARKEALLGDPRTELEYEISEPNGVFGRAVERTGCSLSLDGVIHREDGVLTFLSVENASPADVAGLVGESADVAETTVVTDGEDGGVIQLRIRPPFVATSLADHGAELRDLSIDPDRMRLVVAVAPPIATRTIDDIVTERYADAELRAQRERSRSGSAGREAFVERLTDRQVEVLRTAYHAGYFDSPRKSKGEDVAETLDISPQAFYGHLRAVQRKLVDAAFDAGDE